MLDNKINTMKAFEKPLVFVVPLIDCMERVAVVNQMQQANYFNRKSNTSQPMVQRAIRQTPTIIPSVNTAKEEQRGETLTIMATAICGHHCFNSI